MKTRVTVALSMVAGAAICAAAIQSLHAQAKPPVYVITEVTDIDDAAFKEFTFEDRCDDYTFLAGSVSSVVDES